ncbi:glycosyl transferase family 1, partial [Pediococcus acidilactici]
SLTQAGYQTAKERSINKIGEELKNVYESVLNEKVSSKLKKVHQTKD